MKNILFTIKTVYSEENYFLKANEKQPIESQIDNALAEICFCDAYEIISYKEVPNSPHYESYYKREVVNITCFFGEAGTYDAETRQRLSTI